MTVVTRDYRKIELTQDFGELVESLNKKFRKIEDRLGLLGGLDGDFTMSGTLDMNNLRIKNLPISGSAYDPMPRKEILDVLNRQHTILEEVIASKIEPVTQGGSSSSVATLQVTSLTANRLIATDASKYLTSVADLTSWVAATANQTTVANDGDGTITVGTVQDINTTSSPTFNALTVTNAIGAGSLSTTGHISTTSGTLSSGTDDVQRGYLRLYGSGTGGTYGGSVYLYTAADHDTDIDDYIIQTLRDDLLFSDDANGAIFQITGNGAAPTVEFNYDIVDNQLTASRLLSSDGSKVLTSTDLNSWVTGTANRVTVADDGDGTITLSGPQDLATTSSPTFANLYVPDGGFVGVSGADGWTFDSSNGDISTSSNVGIGQTTFGTNAAKVLAIGSSTAPTTSPADAVQLWCDDISGAGDAGLNIRTEGGTEHSFGNNVSLRGAVPSDAIALYLNGAISSTATVNGFTVAGEMESTSGSVVAFNFQPILSPADTKDAQCFRFNPTITVPAGETIANVYGFNVTSPTKSGTGTVTTATALRLVTPSLATNNYSIMIYNPTEALFFVDAGSAGATEQDWIEVKVGGNTGYIRVYASK